MSQTAVEAIGWASAFILLVTLSVQIRKQWRERRVDGVSRWLFVGQIAASAGFTVYSYLVENWVFVATNAFILVEAFIGQYLVVHYRRRGRIAASP